MEFDKLTSLVLDGLTLKLESHQGLNAFTRERSSFEGWLKVELCSVLLESGLDPTPDTNKVDIACGDWGIDIRTVSTNIPHEQVRSVKRSLTKNVEMLIKDIWKLTNPGKSVSFPKRALLFVVSPLTHDNERWQSIHLGQITSELSRLEHQTFQFESGVPGVLYFGLCSALG